METGCLAVMITAVAPAAVTAVSAAAAPGSAVVMTGASRT